MKSKDLNFEYIEDFADYIVEKVKCDEELFMSIVGKYDEIKNIIKEIITISDVDFEKICLYSDEVDDYKDEYILDCYCDDGVVQIGCEPAKRDGKYLNLAGDETYLISNVSSKIIPLCEGSKVYFVNFDEEYDCDEECDEEYCCDCHCNDKEVANTDKSSYYINHKPVTKDEFDKKYKELHEKYEKNIRSILNDYCEFMDDFNNMFTRLW